MQILLSSVCMFSLFRLVMQNLKKKMYSLFWNCNLFEFRKYLIEKYQGWQKSKKYFYVVAIKSCHPAKQYNYLPSALQRKFSKNFYWMVRVKWFFCLHFSNSQNVFNWCYSYKTWETSLQNNDSDEFGVSDGLNFCDISIQVSWRYSNLTVLIGSHRSHG
jgi:hypothetical protein